MSIKELFKIATNEEQKEEMRDWVTKYIREYHTQKIVSYTEIYFDVAAYLNGSDTPEGLKNINIIQYTLLQEIAKMLYLHGRSTTVEYYIGDRLLNDDDLLDSTPTHAKIRADILVLNKGGLN